MPNSIKLTPERHLHLTQVRLFLNTILLPELLSVQLSALKFLQLCRIPDLFLYALRPKLVLVVVMNHDG